MIHNNLRILNKKAIEKAEEKKVNEQAQALHDELFKNQYELLESKTLLVPNYLMVMAKEKFYKKGGDPLAVYGLDEYSKLLDVPTNILEKWVKEKPEFFIWLHQKRSFEQEINTIILVMARELFNDFSTSSVRDKSQAINSLAKFSSYLSPKGKTEEQELDELIDDIRDPEQVNELLKTYGYVKESIPNIDWNQNPSPDEGLVALEEALDEVD